MYICIKADCKIIGKCAFPKAVIDIHSWGKYNFIGIKTLVFIKAFLHFGVSFENPNTTDRKLHFFVELILIQISSHSFIEQLWGGTKKPVST